MIEDSQLLRFGLAVVRPSVATNRPHQLKDDNGDEDEDLHGSFDALGPAIFTREEFDKVAEWMQFEEQRLFPPA